MKLTGTVLAILVLATTAAFAERGGSMGSTPATPSVRADPAVVALEAYKRGERRLDDVAKMEEKLKTTDEKAAAKLETKIAKQLENAAGDFRRAVKNDGNLYQAHSELGFALRKLGQWDESLKAYDQALRLAPGYAPAIEYRAEAYLGLNRVEEAQEAYLALFAGDRPRADVLFEAMQRWVVERRANPAGVAADQLERFAAWVDQRKTVHRQTTAQAGSSSGRSW
ncbi:MAG TPA: tetratricopeptide repeat protein [Thermoanaerobaculia bacterium]|nr:tetratricopeptide repeat protein [Thermoanaerobaculia bacterium]